MVRSRCPTWHTPLHERRGHGKTRLLLEVCERLKNRGWRAGFLRPQPVDVPPDSWCHVLHQPPLLFLVVDYAETRRAEVVSILSALAQSPGRVRIALLAREAGDWWDGLKREGGGVGDLLMGPATQRYSLQPLTIRSSDREGSFWTAATAFAHALGQTVPASVPSDLDAEYYARVLLLQMSALAAVDGVQVKGDQGILHYIVERERRHWSTQVKASGLLPQLDAGIAQAMTVITLIGGTEDRRHTGDVLEKIPLLGDQPAVVRGAIATILHDAYPGGRKWIESILPDLLGEHLVQEELGREARLLEIAFESAPET